MSDATAIEVRERPILFSGPMVEALLARRKTQTRRVMKSQPHTLRTEGFGYTTKAGGFVSMESPHVLAECPYGKPGDRLWVREAWTGTWHPTRQCDSHMLLQYRADGSERFVDAPMEYELPKAAVKAGNFVTPLFMPRWASRLLLEITEVRVQRLQDISAEDAIAEGIKRELSVDGENYGWLPAHTGDFELSNFPRNAFMHSWEHINGPGSWDENPWVWAVSFKVVSQ